VRTFFQYLPHTPEGAIGESKPSEGETVAPVH